MNKFEIQFSVEKFKAPCVFQNFTGKHIIEVELNYDKVINCQVEFKQIIRRELEKQIKATPVKIEITNITQL